MYKTENQDQMKTLAKIEELKKIPGINPEVILTRGEEFEEEACSFAESDVCLERINREERGENFSDADIEDQYMDLVFESSRKAHLEKSDEERVLNILSVRSKLEC